MAYDTVHHVFESPGAVQSMLRAWLETHILDAKTSYA